MKSLLIAVPLIFLLIITSAQAATNCNPVPPITIFNDGSSSKLEFFSAGGGNNSTAKVILPANFNATAARVNLTGIPSVLTGKMLDVVVVNDISGSMDDNCGPDGVAQPGETPCKINDMKNATTIFANLVLTGPDNKMGLSSYNTRSINSIALTRNITALTNEINSYSPAGYTCISCGIVNGTNTVRLGTNPTKVILLMTDGNANRCYPGVACTDIIAKTEAIQKAADAWSNYGISIYAVAFGADADPMVMQAIANVSHGKFFAANETNISKVYTDIAIEITTSYITNASLDIGGNGVIDWNKSGIFNTTTKVSGWNFPVLMGLLNGCNCTGCSKNLSTGNCTVDFKLHSDSSGLILVDNLSIEGCVYEQNVACSSCSECGGGEDCKDFGEWSAFNCSWPGLCSQSAECFRTRNVTQYECKNAGSVSSYCTINQTVESQKQNLTRNTEGTPCNDGQFCTTPDACTNGVCTGAPKNCNDGQFCTINDRCDEGQDKCLYDSRSCSGNNLSRIAECFHLPDSNPFTWDYAAGFTSVCNEATDLCTTGTLTLTHACSKLNCSAQCETSADCPPFLSDNYCHFGRACQESCLCTPGLEEFCPVPGTVMDSTCYYGVRECTDEGCSIQSCVLQEHQICDSVQGCLAIPCITIPPITIFSDGSSSVLELFGAGGGDNHTAKVILPANFNATAARVDLTGISSSLTGEKKLDVVVVNDISGSMDDNCGPDGTAQPGETPCKINDMKNATTIFANLVLTGPDNKMGLSSYNTRSVNSIALTRNITALTNEINSYSSSGYTCISCGIVNGTDTVRIGTNPIKAILLMTDGNANRCLPGVSCTDILAKQEAIDKAAEAWSNYGISIYAVAFGADADPMVMQAIANVSHGKFYVANDTNITDVYTLIAIEITQSFITNASLDDGANGVIDWNQSGIFNTTVSLSGWNFPVLMGLLNGCNCTGCSKNLSTGTCTVELKIHSDSSGLILVDNLSIEGCVYQQQVTCSSCSQCGGGEDCKDFGSWSEPSCDWPDTCAQTANCTESRTIITYSCNNPGKNYSSCSNTLSQEYQGIVQTRNTTGMACDGGQCLNGVCTGFPACNCTELQNRVDLLEGRVSELENRVGVLEASMLAIQNAISLLQERMDAFESFASSM